MNSAPQNNIQPDKNNFWQDFLQRIKETKNTRWIRFALVTIAFIALVIWIGNPWLGLLWLLLFDIYITCYIPWSWWKKKSGTTRMVMGWVDAIVYALVMVYLIFIFIGQNYKIPSSSLEKTLLVGDYLWVNKFTYGPRIPQTPIHFPLAQHTMPMTESFPSYYDGVSLDYHRLPGLRSIERGDIVVFNYPQGDTVCAKIQNPDYYQICRELAANGVADPKGYILSNPAKFGRLLVRPVDRRENYVKRAIGLPGERLAIRNDMIYINGKAIAEPENVQFNYVIPVARPIDNDRWLDLGVRNEDHGDSPSFSEFAGYKYYNVPLTKTMKAEVEKWPEVNGPIRREAESGLYDLSDVFPYNPVYGWSRPNMGEIWIPKRGATLHLTLNNLPIYQRAIATYEGNDLKVKDGKIFINGKETEYYTFRYDYYWMMGDNRDRSADSRYWGLVPEDHIVGTPMTVLASFDEDRSLFNGKIRNRFFHTANPDKDANKWPKESKK